MNKKTYCLLSIICLAFFAFNIANDKYDMNYQFSELTVNNASDTGSNSATIYGDETNAGVFVTTPKVDLPKGVYLITIQYEADTDYNYISATGKTKSDALMIEEEQYLPSTQQEKVIRVTLSEDVHNFTASVNFCGKGTLVFNNIKMESAAISNTDTIVCMVLISIVLFFIGRWGFWHSSEENKKRALVLAALLAITIVASYPMFLNYLIKGHDISFHLTRIEGIKSGLLSGQFPVRLHSSTLYDYGYATSVFYPELFLYIPAILRIMGVTVTGTVQIFFFLINFATAGIMYSSAYRMTKVRSIGILSSMLYVLASYHLCDLYTRFAIGEALAMAFLPLVIYGVYELLYNDYKKWNYAVLGVTGVLQSHIISTLITAAFILLAAVISIRKLADKKRLFACMKAGITTILLNIWFIVPLITMMKEDMNVTSLGRDVENLTIYVSQLFQNFTVNGSNRNTIGTNIDGVMPLHIGFPIVLGCMLFIYVLFWTKKEETVMISLLSFGSLCAVAATNLFPWKLIVSIPLIGKLARMIQFPWRFLAFAVAFLAIVAAYGLYYVVRKADARKAMIVFTFAICALFASHYFDNWMEKDIYCYKGTIKMNTGIGTGEYYYKGTNTSRLIKRGESVTTSTEELVISEYERGRKAFLVTLENNSKEVQSIELPLAYYPFYKASLNGQELEITKGENNVVKVIIPALEKGIVQLSYESFGVWKVADFVSFITLVLFLLQISGILAKLSQRQTRRLLDK